MRSLRIKDLQRLETRVSVKSPGVSVKVEQTYLEMFGDPLPSGKGTSSLKIFANVAFLFLPLNGVVPNSIS